MARTGRLVLTVPAYAVLAAVAAVAALTLFVLSLNLPLAGFALTADLAVGDRVTLVLGQFPFVGPAFGPLQATLLVAVAALTGVDVAMAAYHFREHGVTIREGGTGAAGVVLGTLGAGCAACGSAILVGLLSLVGVSTSLLWLPLDGLEFALGALVVLVLSVFWLADGMRGGEINGCPVDVRPRV
ncbi:hypothetical protein [Halosegnis marinus]|uniref:DUF2975 domain-containing protein n=1 Tax=Halosegnis marinus TaxID=3034023 RepID=A0ABD5ZLB4_9EURY|nr:hypothetical protein [Halosegnis sp. DT85]